ncbi:MAG: hypothetical protein KC731_32240 [Myxococcales bacterium]|nr:hypothetical protein [Myxococcales bacterium]
MRRVASTWIAFRDIACGSLAILIPLGCNSARGGASTVERNAVETATAEPTATASDETGPPQIRYSFELDAPMKILAAEVCFRGAVPRALVPPTGRARSLLVAATRRDEPLPRSEGRIALDGMRAGDCLRYRVDVGEPLDERDDGARRLHDAAILSPDWWLWAPEPRRPDLVVHARFTGPHAPALPWPKSDEPAYPFVIPESTFVWKAQGAFGGVAEPPLEVTGATLSLTTLGAPRAERAPRLRRWLERAASAAGGLLGRFPVRQAQILVVPEPRRDEPFGYALRGGGASATLLIPEDPTDEALAADWTAVHELLHFSLPPMPQADAWLYEGMVTYLTALARAKAGLISGEEGWWELFDGFARGRRVGTGVTLREESATMHENHSYWRVYWSGAAVALQIDLELRERDLSLPEVVSKLAASRADDSHDWTAKDVVASLNRLCDSEIPAEIVARHLDAVAFPDTDRLARELGVTLVAPREARRVILDDRAPKAALRAQIMP